VNIELVRFAYTPTATLGRLHAGHVRLVTLEEPWRSDPEGPGGQKREPGHYESCIPDGDYDLVPHSGQRFQNVYAIVNPALGVYRWPTEIPVGQKWGRSAILIHNGNALQNTIGCILVGTEHDGERIRDGTSRIALDALREVLGSERHKLRIRPTAGTEEEG
jgi:hypothetical protein